VPVLTAVAVQADGGKELLALELCGSESGDAWKGFVDDLKTRGLRAPLLAIIDGNPGLRQALGRLWPATAVQRCCVHKLRNVERKAPKHALDELREDFHRIVYAASGEAGRTAYTAFERKWAKRCPGVIRSLQDGGGELLTFFTFPKAQWKTLRTTNVIERLNEEFRPRVKTQGSLPTEDGAGSALQPRGARPDQVAEDRRLAEDRHRAQPEHVGSGMITAPGRRRPAMRCVVVEVI